jgi:hypothetical protein
MMPQLLAILFALLPAIVGIANCVADHEDDLAFRITTRRSNDKVEIHADGGKATFSVQSPFGISQAVIERCDSNWPDRVTLNLHLKGLESFKVTNGAVTIEAAVSSQDGKVRQWKDGKEDSLMNADHPYWIEIRRIGNDGKLMKSPPLNDGYFELRLPKAIFECNPTSITASWIDFYR